MSDWRKMYDDKYIGAWDLDGKEVTLTIKGCQPEPIASDRGEQKKPVVRFEEAKKGLVLNKTNGKTIGKLYGNDTTKWPGKRITLFASVTTARGETVECTRVKPSAPAEDAK